MDIFVWIWAIIGVAATAAAFAFMFNSFLKTAFGRGIGSNPGDQKDDKGE